MDLNKTLNNELFTWGDCVKVIDSAPTYYYPNQVGNVCGIRIIEDSKTSELFKECLGVYLYLIEFNDGKAIEIPGSFLKKNLNLSRKKNDRIYF
jgi:hypothetical protein